MKKTRINISSRHFITYLLTNGRILFASVNLDGMQCHDKILTSNSKLQVLVELH
jgi:hypothetical protein